MNTQNRKPYFRNFNDNDWAAYMGCEDKPIIAEFTEVMFDGMTCKLDIVIDLWTNLEGKKVERLGFHFHEIIKGEIGYGKNFVCMSYQEADRKTFKQISREIMERPLSTLLFVSNKFNVTEC